MQKSNQNQNVEAKNRESNQTVIIAINRYTTNVCWDKSYVIYMRNRLICK